MSCVHQLPEYFLISAHSLNLLVLIISIVLFQLFQFLAIISIIYLLIIGLLYFYLLMLALTVAQI